MTDTFTVLPDRIAGAIVTVILPSDLPTDVAEGSIRYVTSDDSLRTFDGAAWHITGGGGATGTPYSVAVFDGAGVMGSSFTLLDAAGMNSLDISLRQMYNSGGVQIADWDSSFLIGVEGAVSVAWNDRLLADASGLTSLDYGARATKDSAGNPTVNWESLLLSDSVSQSSIDWGIRQLYSSTGTTALSWDNGAPKLPDFTTVASPDEGMVAWNFTSHALSIYDGTSWRTAAASGGSSTNNGIPRWSGTDGSTLFSSTATLDATGHLVATSLKVSGATANRAVITSGTGTLSTSATTNTELGYLSGATSSIQTQLDSKFAWVTSVQTTTYTAANADEIVADSSGGPFTITLPATPAVGDRVRFIDYSSNWSTNNVTVARNSSNINGAASDFTLNISGAWAEFIYADATQGWKVIS